MQTSPVQARGWLEMRWKPVQTWEQHSVTGAQNHLKAGQERDKGDGCVETRGLGGDQRTSQGPWSFVTSGLCSPAELHPSAGNCIKITVSCSSFIFSKYITSLFLFLTVQALSLKRGKKVPEVVFLSPSWPFKAHIGPSHGEIPIKG